MGSRMKRETDMFTAKMGTDGGSTSRNMWFWVIPLSHQRFGWWFPDWFQADTSMDVMYCYVGLPKGLGDTPCCCNLNC